MVAGTAPVGERAAGREHCPRRRLRILLDEGDPRLGEAAVLDRLGLVDLDALRDRQVLASPRERALGQGHLGEQDTALDASPRVGESLIVDRVGRERVMERRLRVAPIKRRHGHESLARGLSARVVDAAEARAGVERTVVGGR
jgi:hypothetical protein